MIHTTLRTVFIIAVFAVQSSCTNKKATGFKELLVQKDSQTTAMLIGKEGSERIKLNHLISHDYDKALAIVDQQETELNQIISDIANADTEGLAKGKELQKAAINYYTAVKVLYIFPRKEIEQEKIMRYGKKDDEVRVAQDSMLKLSRQKQELYQNFFNTEEQLYKVTKQFDQENRL